MAKTRFHSLLEERINEEIDSRAASLATGAAADYSQYQYHVGYIIGLRDALKLCNDIERETDA